MILRALKILILFAIILRWSLVVISADFKKDENDSLEFANLLPQQEPQGLNDSLEFSNLWPQINSERLDGVSFNFLILKINFIVMIFET